jgi:hypothetical protein
MRWASVKVERGVCAGDTRRGGLLGDDIRGGKGRVPARVEVRQRGIVGFSTGNNQARNIASRLWRDYLISIRSIPI